MHIYITWFRLVCYSPQLDYNIHTYSTWTQILWRHIQYKHVHVRTTIQKEFLQVKFLRILRIHCHSRKFPMNILLYNIDLFLYIGGKVTHANFFLRKSNFMTCKNSLPRKFPLCGVYCIMYACGCCTCCCRWYVVWRVSPAVCVVGTPPDAVTVTCTPTRPTGWRCATLCAASTATPPLCSMVSGQTHTHTDSTVMHVCMYVQLYLAHVHLREPPTYINVCTSTHSHLR